MGKVGQVVLQMSRKLQSDMTALGRMRTAVPKTFPAFREIRNRYREVLGLIFSIESRVPEAKDDLPPNFSQWVVRQKLTALAIFTDISHAFIGDPPLALTSSLGAHDLLESEKGSFQESLNYFDMMLFEAGIDDKTADELDATRTKIEEIMGMIDRLLVTSPKILEEF